MTARGDTMAEANVEIGCDATIDASAVGAIRAATQAAHAATVAVKARARLRTGSRRNNGSARSPAQMHSAGSACCT